ncbi:SEC-C metal-binding domain-containing protein [Ramlibacter tataouinensis]|nr:SEC-C metal-binding domain-containing protein [Ramlibacter tataouinensis]WBY03593.1 SEC-C metal-binding domain-containing protein [Ramlibacter tataouinensis]
MNAPRQPPRPENEVFAELAALAQSPGYLHALTHIVWRDRLVRYRGAMQERDLDRMFSGEQLIRTEITTLLGLMVKAPWSDELPGPPTLRGYIERTDRLMAELHDSMPGSLAQLKLGPDGLPDFSGMGSGAAMREPIFYGGESAYLFQYRDLALEKYTADDPWLRQHKGFGIAAAHAVVKAMASLQDQKATQLWRERGHEADWLTVDLLAAFSLTAQELAGATNVPLQEVQAVLDALCLAHRNSDFGSLADFNAVYAAPLLRLPDGSVLQLLQYGTAEALYEAPFYWMWEDEPYRPTLGQHRGDFTEEFTVRRLADVFGAARVHRNVTLMRKKGQRAGEIDVLVVFGDRLIVVQTKSKRLSVEARKGNDQMLRKDFGQAIQAAYDQAQNCAELLLQGCPALDAGGQPLALKQQPKEIFVFTVIADHYPALAHQADQFLHKREVAHVREPFVMDVFLLDVISEMLHTPLRFLSYVALRAQVAGRLAINHELTALGHHLRHNLWLDSETHFAWLHDDLAAALDVAMTVRREGIPGPRVPEGILTRFAGTFFETLIAQLEHAEEPAALELGFFLLTLGGNTCQEINERAAMVTRMARADGAPHNFTLGVDSARTGITFHCNPVADQAAQHRLQAYCHARKYAQQAQHWFGLSIDPHGQLQFALVVDYPWQHSAEMDRITAGMSRGQPAGGQAARAGPPKLGRNDPCPCGSGRKYKKCCLPP